MSEHEASRTLVKSPPELWAECSEAESLARHLDQFGEIRISRLEPETAVAWEGEGTSGTVRLEPSGWGTRVILTARSAEEEPASPEVDAEAEAEATADPVEPGGDASTISAVAAIRPVRPALWESIAAPFESQSASVAAPLESEPGSEPEPSPEPDPLPPAAGPFPAPAAGPFPAPAESDSSAGESATSDGGYPRGLGQPPRGRVFSRLRGLLGGRRGPPRPVEFSGAGFDLPPPSYEDGSELLQPGPPPPALEPERSDEQRSPLTCVAALKGPWREPLAKLERTHAPWWGPASGSWGADGPEAEGSEAEASAATESGTEATGERSPSMAEPTVTPSSTPSIDTEAALAAALESLGQAHHRPFSRP